MAFVVVSSECRDDDEEKVVALFLIREDGDVVEGVALFFSID